MYMKYQFYLPLPFPAPFPLGEVGGLEGGGLADGEATEGVNLTLLGLLHVNSI